MLTTAWSSSRFARTIASTSLGASDATVRISDETKSLFPDDDEMASPLLLLLLVLLLLLRDGEVGWFDAAPLRPAGWSPMGTAAEEDDEEVNRGPNGRSPRRQRNNIDRSLLALDGSDAAGFWVGYDPADPPPPLAGVFPDDGCCFLDASSGTVSSSVGFGISSR